MNEQIPSSLKLLVITPDQLLVDEEVQEVSLPGLDGCLGILPGHSPLFVTLGEGDLSFRESGASSQSYAVFGGYAEVQPDRIQVFTRLKDDGQEGDDGRG